jgi:hypothetical protein
MTYDERARRLLQELAVVGMQGGQGKAHLFGCCAPNLPECNYHGPRAVALVVKVLKEIERERDDFAASTTRKRSAL